MKKTVVLFVGIIFIFAASVCTATNLYPMLTDIDRLCVTIDHAGLEPNEPAINWTDLQLEAARRINEAGIEIMPVKGIRLAGIPDLRITIMMTAIEDTGQFVFHMETSLYRLVELADNGTIKISSPVWASKIVMQSTAAEDIGKAVRRATLRQVDEFISAWKTTQVKPSAKSADGNKDGAGQNPALESAKDRGLRTSPATEAPKETCVASKNSKVFHKSECSTAKTISGENLITFASKEQALGSGRRPCRKCNP
jgi:hypothetical protein